MDKFDLIIIGGGPSGTAAALWAAKSGLKTAIVDKHRFPRDKVCGDNLPPLTFELLEELNLLNSFYELHNSISVNKVDFSKENKLEVEVDTSKINIFNVKRQNFDNFLWNSIPPSIIKYEEFEPKKIRHSRFKQKFEIQLSKGVDNVELTSKYIIGADGSNSWTRKKSGFFKDFKIDFATAYRTYATTKNLTEKNEINLISSSSLSYDWVFQVDQNCVNLGVFLPSKIKNQKMTKKEVLSDVNSKNNHEINWQTFKSSSIPTYSESNDFFAQKGVFLVGDAAGFCEPVFGHGIDTGMLTGKIAVQCIHKFQSSVFFLKSRKATKEYNNQIKSNFQKKFLNLRNFSKEINNFNQASVVKVYSENSIKNTNIQ